MSTATAPDYALPALGGRSHFLLRRLHSLTGVIFGGYLVVHLVVNATLAQGFEVQNGQVSHDIYQLQVGKIHDLPFLLAIEWLFIFLPIIYHTVYGIWIALTGQPNAGNYPYGKNWAYVAQRASGIIIVLFLLFHVLSLKYNAFGTAYAFDPKNATRTVASHMDAGWWIPWIVYPLGIVASCYHMANGFWTAAITWGLTVSAGAQRRWGAACAGLFVVMMICGFVALVVSSRLDPNTVPVTEGMLYGKPYTPANAVVVD